MSRFPAVLLAARRRGLLFVAGAALGEAAAAGAAAFAMRQVFIALHRGEPVAAAAIAALPLAALALCLFRMFGRVAGERVGQDLAAELRRVLFDHVSRLPEREVAGLRTGYLAIRFTGDLGAVRDWAGRGLPRLVAAAVLLPALLALLALMVPMAAVAAGFAFTAAATAALALSGDLGRAHARARQAAAKLAADLTERLPLAPWLRSLGRMEREQAGLARLSATLGENSVTRARDRALVRALPVAAAGLAAGGAVAGTAGGGAAVLAAGTGAADLAAALAVIALAAAPLRDLAGVLDRWRAFSVARARAEAVLARPARIPAPVLLRNAGEAAPQLPGAALSFGAAAAPGWGPVTAEVPAGARIVLAGAAGAGRSRLLALAAGLEDAETGFVLLDGLPPALARPGDVLLLGPRTPVLKGSLRRAATLGLSPRPGSKATRAALEAAGLGLLLARIGLEGAVAEDGRNLSSGERAGLLLTRALLARPRLLLLDGLDALLDPVGLARLRDLVAAGGPTMLLACRAPPILRAADAVWHMEAGRLTPGAGAGGVLRSVDGAG